ncbi:Uncharacterised protein [Streptococcus pneumoniae]|nr:Uncharacterised protein [Streptococcus pneumoniae]
MGVLEIIEQFEIDYYPLSYEKKTLLSRPTNSSSGLPACLKWLAGMNAEVG